MILGMGDVQSSDYQGQGCPKGGFGGVGTAGSTGSTTVKVVPHSNRLKSLRL